MKLDSDKIQVFSLTGRYRYTISKSQAEALLSEGKAEIINRQSIRIKPQNVFQKTFDNIESLKQAGKELEKEGIFK